MIRSKLTILITIMVGFFLIIDFIWYKQLQNHIKEDHKSKQSIIFHSLKTESIKLLDFLMYSYEKQHDILIDKHKQVYEVLKDHTDLLTYPLEDLHKMINKGLDEPLYDIYITNKDFVIKNTTFKQDLDFDLSFAQDVFLTGYKLNKIDVSTPIYESYGKTFFSYTNSFLNYKDQKGNILQISYNYKDIDYVLEEIRKVFLQYPSIKDFRSYTYSLEEQAYEIILKAYKGYKFQLKEIIDGIEQGKTIKNKLTNNNIYLENKLINNKKFLAIYTSYKSPIYNNQTKVLYYILLDQSELHEKLYDLNIVLILITIVGILFITLFSIYINKLLVSPLSKIQKAILNKEICIDTKLLSRNDEIGTLSKYYNKHYSDAKELLRLKDNLLKEKNKFIHNAVHEINTPLSVIATNNSLRDLSHSKCEYSKNIVSAVKTLKNTMEDLNYVIHNKENSNLVIIDINKFTKERIEYFNQIAKSSNLVLSLSSSGNCNVLMDQIDLTRLIDNNISNAIKYSFSETTISINIAKANNDISISFSNQGNTIENTIEVFERFYREDNVKGGFGLGLNIVKYICDKYDFKIDVKSNDNINTFTYNLKCHTKIT